MGSNQRPGAQSPYSESALPSPHQHLTYLDRNVSASPTGYSHRFAFATRLGARDGRDSCVSASQKCVIDDVRNGAATIFGLEQALDKLRGSSSISEESRSRDHLVELLSYEKSRLNLAMEKLEKLGFDDDGLKTLRMVFVAAELSRKVFENFLKN